MVREKLFQRLKQEVPYSVQLVPALFNVLRDGNYHIEQNVIVPKQVLPSFPPACLPSSIHSSIHLLPLVRSRPIRPISAVQSITQVMACTKPAAAQQACLLTCGLQLDSCSLWLGQSGLLWLAA